MRFFVRRRKQLGGRGRLLGLIASLSSCVHGGEEGARISGPPGYVLWVLFSPHPPRAAGRGTNSSRRLTPKQVEKAHTDRVAQRNQQVEPALAGFKNSIVVF